jgi:hypothetical protein
VRNCISPHPICKYFLRFTATFAGLNATVNSHTKRTSPESPSSSLWTTSPKYYINLAIHKNATRTPQFLLHFPPYQITVSIQTTFLLHQYARGESAVQNCTQTWYSDTERSMFCLLCKCSVVSQQPSAHGCNVNNSSLHKANNNSLNVSSFVTYHFRGTTHWIGHRIIYVIYGCF